MKATANREGLLTALQVAAGVVPSRTTKEILRNVKLDANGETGAILMATDLELGIRYRISGFTIDRPGSLVLPTSEVIQVLRELSDETIRLEQTESGVRIIGSSAKFEFPTEDPLLFPDIPDPEGSSSIRVASATLALLIRRTLFAASTENSRYALNSILLDVDDEGKLLFVGTDGKRLALMPGSATVDEKPATQILIPPKALNLTQKVLQDPEEEVTIAARENEVLFRTSKVTIYARLVEGRFPRYQDVIPKDGKTNIPLVVGRFHSVLRQARIVTNEESRAVAFRFSPGSLVLISQASDLGESEVKMPIAYDGEEFEVKYDPQYLIDMLRVLEAEEEVTFTLTDERRASLLKSANGYQYVIMPLSKG